MTKLLSAVLFTITLFSAIITTAGCDEDKIWDAASDSNSQYLLLGLLTLRGEAYTVTISLEGINTIEPWAGLAITIGGKRYTLDSTSPLTFTIRSLAELITDVAVTSSPDGYSCTSGYELTDRQLTINISCDTM